MKRSRRCKKTASLLVLAAVGHVELCSASYVPFGLQTGGDLDQARSTYVSSMSFNSITQELTVTGTTYGNYFAPEETSSAATDSGYNTDCFLGILHIPPIDKEQSNLTESNELSWIGRRQFGGDETSESCASMTVGGGNALVLAQSIGRKADSGKDLVHTSMVLEYNNLAELVGGSFDYEHSAELMTAITSSKDFESIFVASRIDNTEHITEATETESIFRTTNQEGKDPNKTNVMRHPNLEGSNTIRLKRLYSVKNDRTESYVIQNDQTGIEETLATRWKKEFQLESSSDFAQVSTLKYLSPVSLVMAGFTSGAGEAFGYPSREGGIESTPSPVHGFVTAIHPFTGEVTIAKRIETLNYGHDVRVWGMCTSKSHNHSFIFIVGETTGILLSSERPRDSTGGAFIAKMNADSLEIEWVRQLQVDIPEYDSIEREVISSFVAGIDCEVTPDDEFVYFAGQARKGASLAIDGQNVKSMGGDDIFIAQFEAKLGILQYAKQFGSSQDDWLAKGKALGIDEDGNLILVGNTRGSLFREKDNIGVSDMFTMTVSRTNGEIVETFEELKKGTNESVYANEQDVDSEAIKKQKSENSTLIKPTPTEPPYVFEDNADNYESLPVLQLTLVALSLSISCMLIVMMCYTRQRRLQKQSAKQYIYEYEEYGMAPLEEYSDASSVDAIGEWSQKLLSYGGPNSLHHHQGESVYSQFENGPLIIHDQSFPEYKNFILERNSSKPESIGEASPTSSYDYAGRGGLFSWAPTRQEGYSNSFYSYVDDWMDRTTGSFTTIRTQIMSNLWRSDQTESSTDDPETDGTMETF